MGLKKIKVEKNSNSKRKTSRGRYTSSSRVPRSLVGMNFVDGLVEMVLAIFLLAAILLAGYGLNTSLEPTSASIRFRRSIVSVVRMVDRSVWVRSSINFSRGLPLRMYALGSLATVFRVARWPKFRIHDFGKTTEHGSSGTALCVFWASREFSGTRYGCLWLWMSVCHWFFLIFLVKLIRFFSGELIYCKFDLGTTTPMCSS